MNAHGPKSIDSPEMAPVRDALRRLLTGHEPYPALVVDRHWTLVDANDGPSVATGVELTDLLPAGVTDVRVTGATCTTPNGMTSISLEEALS